ncbi:MAG: AAA family ATPase [Planctomycetota bacterium]
MTRSRQEAEPPLAIDAERAVVGSMLLDPSSAGPVVSRLRPADFVDEGAREVFRVAVDRHRRGEPLDPVLMLREVKPKLGDDSAVIIAGLGESVTTAANAAHYADLVADAALKRRILDAASLALSSASNGHAGAEVLSSLHSFAEDELRTVERQNRVDKFTLGTLVADYPRLNEPIVEGLFRRGETCNVIAASKVGKSWFAYGLALSIISGWHWLGRFPVARGRVLLIDNELHRQTLASRIPTVCEAIGLRVEEVANDLAIWPLRGNLRSLAELAVELESIEPGEYQAIIFDAKYRFAEEGVSENDNSAETRVYNLLDQIAARTQAALVVIHHASKGSQAEKAVTDVGAGAGAQSRATDCHLVLRPHEEDGCAVLDAAVRSFAPVEPVVLRWGFPLWQPAESLDPTALKGSRGKADETRFENDRRDKLTIIDVLRKSEKPLTNRELRPLTPFGKDKINRLLDQLQFEGAVSSDEVTKRGNVCHEYRLTDDSDE